MTMREKTRLILKAAVTIVLIAYLVAAINMGVIVSTLLSMDPLPLIVCVPIICMMYVIRAQKWLALLRPIGIRMPLATALKIFLIGTFYGSVTPGRAGEISRSFYLDDKKSRTIPTIIIDRVTDIVCLLAMSVLSLLAFFKDSWLVIIVALLVVFFGACSVALLDRRAVSRLFRLFRIADEDTEDYLSTVRAIAGDRRALAAAFTLTLAYYVLNMAAFWLVLRSLSPAIDPLMALTLPVIIILGNIPVSISGLGVRELVSVSVFSSFGQGAAYGFSASFVLYLLTSLAPGLVGSIFTFGGISQHGTEKREL